MVTILASPTSTSLPAVELPPYPVRLLTVQEYLEMHRLGIFDDDDNLELLEGWVVKKLGKNPPHIRCSTRLNRLFLTHIPTEWTVHSEASITLSQSAPEPDFSILRGDMDEYANRLANASDIAVVVEISDTTLAKDRSYKTQLYARAAIPVYWLISLNERQIEVYSDPDPATASYLTTVIFGEKDDITLVLDGDEVALIPVVDILP